MPDHPYHPKIPASCPPSTSTPASGPVYRGIRKSPISEQDFLSAAELEQHNSDAANCEHWGLSVWTDEAAVRHARELHGYMRRWHIALGTVANGDGMMLPTPNGGNPGHTTFWKVHGLKIAAKFTIVMAPNA